jgi:hypothetical protein
MPAFLENNLLTVSFILDDSQDKLISKEVQDCPIHFPAVKQPQTMRGKLFLGINATSVRLKPG